MDRIKMLFRCGDVVMLRSGGTAMTVASRAAVECPGGTSVRYTVTWIDRGDALHVHVFDFPASALRRPPAEIRPEWIRADLAEHEPDEIALAHPWRFAVGDAVRLVGRREVGVVVERVYQETGSGNWQAHYSTTLPARDRVERIPLEVSLVPVSDKTAISLFDLPASWGALGALGGVALAKPADKPEGGRA